MDHKPGIDAKDEIGQLSKAFDKMTSDLKKTTVSRDYMDNIISSMINSLIVVTPQGKIETVNQATLDLLGYKQEELIGKDPSLIFQEEEEEEEEEIPLKGTRFDNLIKEGRLTNYETSYKVKDGRLIPVLFSGTVMKGRDGNIISIVCVAQDITEIKKTENKLAEEAIRRRILIEQSRDGIVVLDQEGKVYEANKKYAEMLGYSSEEVMQLYVWDWDTQWSRERLLEMISSVDDTGDHFETRHRRKDGTFFDVEISTNGALCGDHKLVFCVVRDITKRKKAEEQLKRLKDHFKSLIQEMPSAVFTVDLDKRVTSWNSRAEQITRLKKEEVLGKKCTEIWKCPSCLEKCKLYADELRKPIYRAECLISVKDKTFHASKNMDYLRDETGKIIGGLEAFTDVTERKRAEDALRESENKYRTLLEKLPQRIFSKDKNSIYISCNENFARDLGIRLEEFKGKTDYDFFPQKLAEKYRRDDKKIMESGKTEDIEEKYIQKGKKIIVHTVKIPLKDEQSNVIGILGIFWDITERKREEEKLQSAYQELKNTQEQLIQSSKMAAMGQLAAGISHELNQPLTGIKGFAQAISMDINEDNSLKQDLNKIIEQSDRMDKIIKNIRFFARKAEFMLKKIDINQPIEDALMLLNEQLKVHNIRLEKSLATGLPQIQADSNQLQQVFLNLITNARDAIDSLGRPGGGKMTIKSYLSEDKKHIEIIFKDDGGGISKENLEHIFNPFFTTKSPDGGIGLGLSIGYRIIENHKGKIEAESEEGKATVFKITFPVYNDDKGVHSPMG